MLLADDTHIELPGTQGYASIVQRLLAHGGDPNGLRPWVGRDNRTYLTVNTGRMDYSSGTPKPKYVKRLVANAPTSLTKDQWILLDDAIIKAAKPRLRAFGDLRAAGNQLVIPNGMAKTVLQFQMMGDITPATISMTALRESERDRPEYDIGGLPLPIVHKNWSFDLRQLLQSQAGGGEPLDTTMAELATRRVAEEVEKLTVGVGTYSFAGYTVYGYANLPQRKTQVLTAPASWGAGGPGVLIDELLAMKDLAFADNERGPWVVYASPFWERYLDDDYTTGYPGTLRLRVGQIEGLSAIRTLDYLTGKQLIMVEMQPEVARAVVGMEMRTVTWETQGGMALNYKVMCIMVPQLRYNIEGNTGIIHGTAP